MGVALPRPSRRRPNIYRVHANFPLCICLDQLTWQLFLLKIKNDCHYTIIHSFYYTTKTVEIQYKPSKNPVETQ